MGCSSPMKPLLRRPLHVYWAGRWFTKPGVYVWAFKGNRRILPVPHLIVGHGQRPRSWRLHYLRTGRRSWP